MSWRPGASVTTARARAGLLTRVRDRFARHGVLEVQTPSLCRHAVTDVHIDCLSAAAPALQQHFFLRTSPEYALKRLLAAGYPDVYEIGPVFRDGECGARHQPEFTMLEWYRHDFALDAIVDDTLQVLNTALKPLREHDDLRNEACVQTYDQWLHDALGCDSDTATSSLRMHVGDDFPASLNDDKHALLDWLFDRHVAATMPTDRFSVVTHYPVAQAALACLDASGERALRFEVYLGALELANGFVELTDADEQRTRFNRDRAIRKSQGRTTPDIDTEFLAALSAGLPACAGVAVGIDRLVMLMIGSDRISDVVSFPHTQV